MGRTMSIQSVSVPGVSTSDITLRRKAIFVIVSVLLACALFSGALGELVHRWIKQEEYSHGFFIPIIAIWLLWSRRVALIGSVGQPSWGCLLYTSPSPRDRQKSRMPS